MASEPKRPPHRVLLVDRHEGVRAALALLLEAEGMLVCAQARTHAEALAQAEAHAPDLVVVDFPSEEEGWQLFADLQARCLPVVVCSAHEGPGAVARALRAGARGYAAKREANAVLARVIREVLAGWVVVSPGAADERPPGG